MFAVRTNLFRRGISRGRKTGGFSRLLRKNKSIAAFSAVLLGGELLGIFLIGFLGSDARFSLHTILENSLSRQTAQETGLLFLSSMFSVVLLLLVCFLLGLSLWGMFLVPLVPLFQGMGLGISAAMLFQEKGLHGIAFFLLAVLPGALLSAAAVLLACRESLKASYSLFRKELQKDPAPFVVRTYFIRFGLLTVLAILSAAADTLTSFWFSPYFL